ncbi:MAG: hypothetical protein JO300_12290 [Silvibacterium sp.]|nr:hypothetical protein [Silvibacterium sp.]MBV8438485.1 hypothetical protein [Silvibacterium sp.]
MPDQKPTAPPEPLERFPNVDRPRDLGSDKGKTRSDPAEPREKSIWKLLLQFRPFLPHLARLVPMLEFAVGPLQSAGVSSDIRKAVAGSMADSIAKLQQSIQRDLTTVTTALDQQSDQLKRLEDQLTGLQQASDKFAASQADIARELDRLGKLARLSAAGLGILLLAVIVMTGILVARLSH